MAAGMKMASAGLLLVAAPACFGQDSLPDPTRPPEMIAPAAASSAAASGPVLQSVILPKEGRAVAVISGERVTVGERYGASRLVRVTEAEAVLAGPEGKLVLRLTPEVHKHEKAAGTGEGTARPAGAVSLDKRKTR